MHDGCEKDGSLAGESGMLRPADVVLHPADVGRDAEALRKAMADSWRVPRFNSTAAFAAWLRERLERRWLEFAVVAPAGNPAQVAGYAVAWDYRSVDGHAHVEVRVGGMCADGRAGDSRQLGGSVEHGSSGTAAGATALGPSVTSFAHDVRDGGAPMNRSDGRTRLTASYGPDMPSRESLFAQAAGEFVSRLFREYPLRKVFIEEVAGTTPLCDGGAASFRSASAAQLAPAASIASAVQAAAPGQPASAARSSATGFVGGLPALKHEMTLKEYTFRRGAYRDLDIWSLSREAWEEWVHD